MHTLLFALILAQSPATCIGQAPDRCSVLLVQQPMVHAPVVQAIVESPQERKAGWLHAAIAAHVVAHFADIATTQYALGTGRYREANPVLRGLGDGPVRMALVKGGIAVGTSYLLLRVHKRHPKLTVVLAAAAAVGTSYIAARNARSLRTPNKEHRP